MVASPWASAQPAPLVCTGVDVARPAHRPAPAVALVPVTSDERAAHVLHNATFGATAAGIREMRQLGSVNAWLDAQMALPPGRPHWDEMRQKNYAAFPSRAFGVNPGGETIIPLVWEAYITAPDQLRKRVGAALLEIFVVNKRSGFRDPLFNQLGAAAFIDLLESHAFGNYRQLIEAVARSPIMGNFLSHRGNTKAAYDTNGRETRIPDENFARELLQLFSIGLHELNPDGTPKVVDGRLQETYTQADITNLARVFTGWDYPDPRIPRTSDRTTWCHTQQLMTANASLHSPEPKHFLGLKIPANTSAEESLKLALDHIAAHPNVGPFIGRQLIQRLVASNPSPAYVARVSQAFANNGAGVRGDLRHVIRAVLTDPEAIARSHGGKLREPMIRVTAVARALGAQRRVSTGQFPIGNLTEANPGIGQTPVTSPSVFNFFRPGYTPPGSDIAKAGRVAPEFQIVTGSALISSIAFLNQMIADVTAPDETRILDYAELPALRQLAGQPDALLSRCILLLAAVDWAIPAWQREQMVALIRGIPASQPLRRVKVAMQLVASHPVFLAQ